MRKIVRFNDQVIVLASGASAALDVQGLLAPVQGERGVAGPAADSIRVIAPSVTWHVEESVAQRDVRFLQAELGVVHSPLNGAASYYRVSRDVSSVLRAGEGRLTWRAAPAGVQQPRLTLTNRDTASHTILVRTEVWGEWLPVGAPAVVDATAGGGLPAERDMLPFAVPSLDDDWPEEPGDTIEEVEPGDWDKSVPSPVEAPP